MQMTYQFIKPILRIGIVTAACILLYQVSNLLLVYHYFKFEYYLAAATLIALITGIILTKKYYASDRTIAPAKNVVADLTNKELLILAMINDGKTNKEIAILNFVEVSTVKTHINNIYCKLGVNNRKEASEIYRQYLSIQKSTLSPPRIV